MTNLQSWLEEKGLGQYYSSLNENGLSSVNDLKTMNESDISEAADEINMKFFHKKKFIRAVEDLKGTGQSKPNNEEGFKDKPTYRTYPNNPTSNINEIKSRIEKEHTFVDSDKGAVNSDGTFSIQFADNEVINKLDGFRKTDSVISLKKRYAVFDKGDESKYNQFMFSVDGNEMTDLNQEIGVYGCVDSYSLVTVVHYVDGGTQMSDESRRRVITPNKNGINLTVVRTRDCIMGDKLELCARLPCGHFISPYSMFTWVKTTLEKSSFTHEIPCPVVKCEKPIPWKMCMAIGDFNQVEFAKYSSIRNRRKQVQTGLVKECPSCKSLTKKPADLGKFRVSCTKCRKYDWCFVCCKKWLGKGFVLCGNHECPIWSRQVT
jgi:hypothetical protein